MGPSEPTVYLFRCPVHGLWSLCADASRLRPLDDARHAD